MATVKRSLITIPVRPAILIHVNSRLWVGCYGKVVSSEVGWDGMLSIIGNRHAVFGVITRLITGFRCQGYKGLSFFFMFPMLSGTALEISPLTHTLGTSLYSKQIT